MNGILSEILVLFLKDIAKSCSVPSLFVFVFIILDSISHVEVMREDQTHDLLTTRVGLKPLVYIKYLRQSENYLYSIKIRLIVVVYF